MKLVVVHEFHPYKKGDEITDADTVAQILASEHAPKVVKVADPQPN